MFASLRVASSISWILRGADTNMLAKARVRGQPLLHALLDPSLRHIHKVGQFVLVEVTLAAVAWALGRLSNLAMHDGRLSCSHRACATVEGNAVLARCSIAIFCASFDSRRIDSFEPEDFA